MSKFYHKIFIIFKILILSLYFLILIGYLNTHLINKTLNTNIINFEKNIEKIFKIFLGITSIYLFFPTKNNIVLTNYDKYFGVGVSLHLDRHHGAIIFKEKMLISFSLKKRFFLASSKKKNKRQKDEAIRVFHDL